MSEQKTQTREWLNSLLLLVLGISIWWYTADFPSLDEGYPGPSLFPRMIAVGFALCGVLLLITGKKPAAWAVKRASGNRSLLLAGALLLIVLFPWLIDLLGFVPGLGVLCFGFGLLLRVVWWKAAITAVLTAGIIYFLFVNGLGVSL